MFRPWIVSVALLALSFAAARPARAQSITFLPQAAEPAKKKFDAKIEDLRSKYAADVKTASDEHVVKLDEQIKAATEKGDLDRVLAFKAEKEGVEADKAASHAPAALKIVQSFRTAYEAKRKAAAAAFDKAAKLAQADLLADLDLVVKEETKEGRIESALQVRDAKKDIEKAALPPADAAVKSLAKVPAPVPPSPAPAPKPEVTAKTPPGSFTWDKALANPAKVQVAQIASFALDAKVDKPFTPPGRFTGNRAIIYGNPKDKYAGVADIKVLEDGYLFVACNFRSQGNPSGGWMETRWLAPKFVENGWKKLDDKDFAAGPGQGADAAKGFEFFVKFMKAGEEMKLRCNKYMPPYAIVFEAESKK